MTEELIHDSRLVSVYLIMGEEAETTAEVLGETYPDAKIQKFPAYISVERPDSLVIDVAAVRERLGRDFDVPTFLVSLSSYIGRINVEDDRVRLETEVVKVA